MTMPLVVLAILSTVGGLIGIPYALSGGKVDNYFEKTLEPASPRRYRKRSALPRTSRQSHGAVRGP